MQEPERLWKRVPATIPANRADLNLTFVFGMKMKMKVKVSQMVQSGRSFSSRKMTGPIAWNISNFWTIKRTWLLIRTVTLLDMTSRIGQTSIMER